MSGAKVVTFSLINKDKTKVLLAEADGNFVDILLSFLTMPLGRIVKVLKKHYGQKAPVIGSLSTSYNGTSNLDKIPFRTESTKPMLLDPKSLYDNTCRRLKSYDGVFTTNTASFVISDDLRVVPNVINVVSIIQSLNDIGIAMTDMKGPETRNVTFGYDEIMALLKESFISRTPLSDLILGKKEMNSATVKAELGSVLLHQIEKEAVSTSSKKIILKVILQKSMKKFLFVQSDEHFANFLFSILTIPLGRVEWLLGGNTCLNNIDNLYRSIADNLIDDMYLSHQEAKGWLTKPSFHHDMCTSSQCLDSHSVGNRHFVKGPRMYMVTDDLVVTPLSLTSSFSILNEMKISLSDAEELEMQVGLEEALRILKASLTSTAVLTDALINPISKKEVKQEH